MKKKISQKIGFYVLMAIGLGLALIPLIYGIKIGNVAYALFGATVCLLIIAAILTEIFSKKKKGNQTTDGEPSSAPVPDIAEKYDEIGDDNLCEVGFVKFLKEGVEFSAEGKYGCVENFNGQKGFHFGFRIEGTKLVSKPESYEDVMDLEDMLFNIEIGYFEEVLLSDPENDNGVVLNDISNLEGQKIEISKDNGYIAIVNTTDIDEIDYGEIEFVEWNDKSKIIRFKLIVRSGLNDIVVGTVSLTEDEGFDDEDK